jgi:hypothetical protein
MEWTPRVLWQGSVAGADLRVLPWPDGLALRRQAADPLREATYELVQGAEVRTVQAWRIAPLAALPPSLDLIEVPFVDLTVAPPAAERAEVATEVEAPVEAQDADAADGRPDPTADGPDEATAVEPVDVPAAGAPGDEAAASPVGEPRRCLPAKRRPRGRRPLPGTRPPRCRPVSPPRLQPTGPPRPAADGPRRSVGGAAAAEASATAAPPPRSRVRRGRTPPGTSARSACSSYAIDRCGRRPGPRTAKRSAARSAPRRSRWSPPGGPGVGEVEAHAYFPGGGPPPALVVVESERPQRP